MTTLVTGTTTHGIASDIAVDSASLYWTDIYGGAIKKVSINGGTAVTLATGLYNPGPIAIDSSNVYWAEPDGVPGAIKKTSISGGSITTLAVAHCPIDLAVDTDYVFWAEKCGGASLPAVKKVSISGGGVTTLAQGTPASVSSMAIDSTSIYWIVGGDINYYPPPGSINKIPKSY